MGYDEILSSSAAKPICRRRLVNSARGKGARYGRFARALRRWNGKKGSLPAACPP